MVIDQGSSTVVTLDDYKPFDQSTLARDAADSDAIRESIDSCRKSKRRQRDCKPKTFSTEDIDSDPSDSSEADMEIKFKPKQRRRANIKSATKMKDKKSKVVPKNKKRQNDSSY